MAARRDRERRRPSSENRYRFATPESAVSADESVDAVDGGEMTQAIDAASNRQSRAGRTTSVDPKPGGASTRGGSRAAPLPFSHYTADYAYVLSDLRRVGLVIGSLLLILIVLNFVLPH
ncbi:MAG TPA: hypothetical protein VKV73_06830 [Chloroflexota bacterium]|nr:hypothetical protein [Chloroflexota bacterium]